MRKKTTEEFIEESKNINGEKYDYSKTVYKDIKTKVFEKLCESFPNENILFEVGRKTLKWIGSLRLDIYFPDYNIAIEYDGKQHFVPIDHFGGEIAFENRKKLDKLKESLCKKNGCVLFRIPYNYTDNELLELTNSIANIIKKVR